jgi:hypothetical protein
MPAAPARVTISFTLDKAALQNALAWAERAAELADAIDPRLMQAEGYRIVDGTVFISLRAADRADRVSKLLDDHDGLRRFRTRMADLGMRANLSVGELENDAPEYQIVRAHEQDSGDAFGRTR